MRQPVDPHVCRNRSEPGGAQDATALLRFRRLLENQDVTRAIFEAIERQLAEQGFLLREGTIVDATIIAAPLSTKNRATAGDLETAPDQEGERMALWHEGAHWRRCRSGTGAHGSWHSGGERQRHLADREPAAWRGQLCARRCRVYWSGETRGSLGSGSAH